MRNDEAIDYYELLQISSNAEPETIHRVYRLLAQRFHPDNQHTGDSSRFRALHVAYTVLSDPEKRAQYDLQYHEHRQKRWRLAAAPPRVESDFELEHVLRLTVLEVLCAQRRAEPDNPGVFVLDLEGLTGRPREHLEFTMWYLTQKNLVQRGDNARLAITVFGVDYLDQHYHANLQRRRLGAGATAA